MASEFPFNTLNDLLDYKYGQLNAPRRLEFHKKAIRHENLLKWKQKGSGLLKLAKRIGRILFFGRAQGYRAKLRRKIAIFRQSQNDLSWLIGKTGIAKSPLQLTGFVEINGLIYDAVAEPINFISKGEVVVVIEIDLNRIRVRSLNN
ncbi:MAG: NfeD family protein [Bacteroidota bacterium]